LFDPKMVGTQIADGEPEIALPAKLAPNAPVGGYDARLNGTGPLVQAYWSQTDGAFVVPDGNAQTINQQPNWQGTVFQGTFNQLPAPAKVSAAAPLVQRTSSGNMGGQSAAVHTGSGPFQAPVAQPASGQTTDDSTSQTVASLPSNVAQGMPHGAVAMDSGPGSSRLDNSTGGTDHHGHGHHHHHRGHDESCHAKADDGHHSTPADSGSRSNQAATPLGSHDHSGTDRQDDSCGREDHSCDSGAVDGQDTNQVVTPNDSRVAGASKGLSMDPSVNDSSDTGPTHDAWRWAHHAVFATHFMAR
jgi:hypothetical protein